MLVKPAEGRKVRDPRTMQHILDAGAEVADTDIYWLRRIAQGDVTVVKASVPKASVSPAAPAAQPAEAPHKPNEAAIEVLEGAIKQLEGQSSNVQEQAK